MTCLSVVRQSSARAESQCWRLVINSFADWPARNLDGALAEVSCPIGGRLADTYATLAQWLCDRSDTLAALVSINYGDVHALPLALGKEAYQR